MKSIASISLGPLSLDCNFSTSFLGHDFEVVRTGTDNDFKAAEKLVVEWRDKVDAIGLGLVHDHYSVGTRYFHQRDTARLEELAGDTLVSTGARLREIVQEWSLRSAQQELSGFFNNAKVLFMSGAANYRLASVMAASCIHCMPWNCMQRAVIRCCESVPKTTCRRWRQQGGSTDPC